MEFTGSDWCPPCSALQKRPGTEKNSTQAPENFVLLMIDNLATRVSKLRKFGPPRSCGGVQNQRFPDHILAVPKGDLRPYGGLFKHRLCRLLKQMNEKVAS